jgi:Na+-translocating ferredoxin:NAD+ oxidoreductase RnfG subunit
MTQNRNIFQQSNFISFLWMLLLLNSFQLYGQTSIETKAMESLKKMFGDSVSVSQVSFLLNADEKKLIAERSKNRWASDTLAVFRCFKGGNILGYGFLDNVKGKMQFITYLVGILPTGEIKDTDVLAYRESYGGEIGNESFRKQFRGKSANDDLRPGFAIKSISGATISVRAITYGVQRILTTYGIIKKRLDAYDN